MADAETIWILSTGGVGLAAFASGSMLSAVPPVDADLVEHIVESLSRRRGPVLVGSVLSVTGAALLLWPVAAVSTTGTGEAWSSLALFSVAIAVLGFTFMTTASMLVAALVWRDPRDVPGPVTRLCLDASHLAIWSVSAPIGAAFITATTAVGLQNKLFGRSWCSPPPQRSARLFSRWWELASGGDGMRAAGQLVQADTRRWFGSCSSWSH